MWNHPYYITQFDLYNWCVSHSSGEYRTALTLYNAVCEDVAEFFDGSLGTFVNPITGETIEYPEICTYIDISGYFAQEFGLRSIIVSEFDFCKDKDEQFWTILNQWAERIRRFCRINKIKYIKLIQLSAINYNPLADFRKKSKEIQGHAPYASLGVDSNGVPNVSNWTATNNSKDYSSTTTTTSGGITNTHQTTTYDSTTFRDESKDIQTGGTTTTNGIPNSGDFRTFEEEGNDANPMQDIIMKEFDIAGLWDIVDMFMNELAKTIYLQCYQRI